MPLATGNTLTDAEVTDRVRGEVLQELLRQKGADEAIVRRQTTRMFETAGVDRAKGWEWETPLREFADEVGSEEAGALADVYDGFTGRIDDWLAERQPSFVSDRWWGVARREIMYRIETWAWPLGSKDVLRLWDWAMGTFADEMAKLIDKYGGEQRDLLATTLSELVQFLNLWKPTVEAGLKVTGRGVAAIARVLVVKLLKAIVDFLIRLLYNGVVLVLGVVIRILKSIPYTMWLGLILGYVLAAVYTVEKALPG